MRWLALLLALAVAAPAATAAPRKKHRVAPAHRLAKKPPRHKGVTFKRPGVAPSASPVPQGSPPQPTATPAPTPTATPAPPPPTEWRTGVDLDEVGDRMIMRLTYKVLKAGRIELVPKNLGEDDHDLTVKDAAGATLAQIDLPSGGGDPDSPPSLSLDLPPGQYRLFCSIANHDELGMHATLTLR